MKYYKKAIEENANTINQKDFISVGIEADTFLIKSHEGKSEQKEKIFNNNVAGVNRNWNIIKKDSIYYLLNTN